MQYSLAVKIQETENVISEYLSIQSAFAEMPLFLLEMEGKFENRLDEIEENYPIEELIHQKESNSKKKNNYRKKSKFATGIQTFIKIKKIQKR